MKVFSNILKVVAALAAVAGIVYVVVNYGDKIVAWAKKLLGKCECCCGCGCDCECECDGECCEGECCCEEQCECCEAEEVTEAPAEEAEPVATEADFEG